MVLNEDIKRLVLEKQARCIRQRARLKAWGVKGMRLAESKVRMTTIDEVLRVTQEETNETYSMKR